MPYLYILYSEKLNKYYIGSAKNKDVRLRRHNDGTEKFTSTGLPWKSVYFEYFENIADARRRELEIKKKKSRRHIEWLIDNQR